MRIEVTLGIFTQLVGDANVTGKVGIFAGAQAIFTGLVPEKVVDGDDNDLPYVANQPPFSSEPVGGKTGDTKSREEICKVVCVVPSSMSIVDIENLEKAVRDSLHRTDLGTIGATVLELSDVSSGINQSDIDYVVRSLDVRVIARE